MKKSFYIQGLLAGILSFGFLIFAFIKNPSILIRLALTPFIICSLCFLAKEICLMLHKPKPAHYFHIGFSVSFLCFAFGFLIYWCYLNIKNGQYGMAIFSIPFWIVAIHFARVVLFKKKGAASDRKKSGRWSAPLVITGFLVSVILVSGVVLLFAGGKEAVKNAQVRQNYASAEGTLVDYGIYDQSVQDGKEHTTYYLVYEYEVSGATYTAKTDYGTGSVPSFGSTKEIRYDPQNPENAILTGTNSSYVMLFIGGFFTLGGTVFVLVAFQHKGVLARAKFDVLGAYIGFVLLAVACGLIFLRYGETGSVWTGLTSMGIFMIIPILFILAGSALMIKSIRSKKAVEKDD